jgi:hypothetical protein
MVGKGTARVLLGAALLALVAAGCGGDEPVASATVRPIGVVAEREPAAAPEEPLVLELWEEEAAEEPEAARAVRNRPPRILGLQVRPAEHLAGQDVRVRAAAEDPDGDEVRLRYAWLVNGEEVEASGTTFATASLQRGDTVQVQVVASDGRRQSQSVRGPLLTVDNAAPAIVSKPGPPGPDGVFRYQVRADDPDGDRNLRFRLAQGPRGMTVTAVGGLVEWPMGEGPEGTYPVEIVVEDPRGATGHQRFELTMAPPAAPAP